MARDRILLRGLGFYGYHGVNPEERQLGQRFIVDLELGLELGPAGTSDDLSQTINYSQVYRLVREIVEGPAVNLIETVAERIAQRILEQTPAREVSVQVTKPWAPIKGMVVGEVAVAIHRTSPTSSAEGSPTP